MKSILWIHEHDNWPNLVWEDEKIKPKLKSLKIAIEDWRQLHKSVRDLKLINKFFNSEHYNQLNDDVASILTEFAVKTSNIEGEYPDEKEVRKSISRRLNNSKKRSGSHEGLVDMIFDANRNYMEPLKKERICKWQKWLFPKNTDLRRIKVGGYREGPVRVITEGSYGMGAGGDIVHYEAPHFERVQSEMDRFLDWFENGELDIDLIVKAGKAHIWFEFIHPFDDGNGRVGRALCDAMLARAVDCDEPFHNFSGHVANQPDSYYKLLEMHGKMATGRNPMDITIWLEWFLESIELSTKSVMTILERSEEKMKVVLYIKKFNLNERQWRVIRHMLETENVTQINRSEFATIGKCGSNPTAARDIAALREMGIFVENKGGGRSANYRLVTWTDIERWEAEEKKEENARISAGRGAKS